MPRGRLPKSPDGNAKKRIRAALANGAASTLDLVDELDLAYGSIREALNGLIQEGAVRAIGYAPRRLVRGRLPKLYGLA